MKILIISHMYPSIFNEIGGIFVHQQVKELQKQSCEVIIISPVPWAPFPIKYLSKKWKRYSELPRKTNWEGIKIYYPRWLEFPKSLFFASSGKRMYHGIKKTICQIKKKFNFDLIHSHVALPDGYAGMLIAKKFKKPLVITIHGQDFQQTIYKNKNCKKNIEKVINYSKKTILVSEKLKNIGINKLNINPEKLIVIPNGINVEDLYDKKSPLSKKYANKKIILSVSNLIKVKGIDLNLHAIAKLKERHPYIYYLIIGDGIERKTLEVLVQKLDLKNNVEFLGQLSHKKVMEYMSICDIFSLPSWNEGFGIVYIEAMVHGKSAIACQGEGIDGIIRDKKTGILVKPKNVNSLVGAVNFLLSNPEKTKKIGEKAKKLVLKNYTWIQAVRRIIKIYKKTLKDKNGLFI